MPKGRVMDGSMNLIPVQTVSSMVSLLDQRWGEDEHHGHKAGSLESAVVKMCHSSTTGYAGLS